MERLVSNELERMSQGALSGPSISKLMLMPFTLLCIARPFCEALLVEHDLFSENRNPLFGDHALLVEHDLFSENRNPLFGDHALKKSMSSASSAAGAVVGMKWPAVSISSKRAPGIFPASSWVPDQGRTVSWRPATTMVGHLICGSRCSMLVRASIRCPSAKPT